MSKTAAKAFERDGFVVVSGLFDEQEIARISTWTDELERQPEVPGRSMKYYEPSLLSPDERVLQRIENFCPFHDGFAGLCDGDKLRGSVSRLFGEPRSEERRVGKEGGWRRWGEQLANAAAMQRDTC